MRPDQARERFRHLHDEGLFVLPNAWDVGSARLLASLGFPAVATTSSGLAASLGRMDQQITRDELAAHVESLIDAVEVPVSVDAESGYAPHPDGVAETVRLLAGLGAAGVSIEDYQSGVGVLARAEAVERVEAAVQAAAETGLVLTARAENHLYGVDDLEDTMARLHAFRRAGADVLYAPGITDPAAIGRIVDEVGAPVNVLLLPGGPTVPELTALGVRRVSTGGALAFTAYGAAAAAARELRDNGTSTYTAGALSQSDRAEAFGGG